MLEGAAHTTPILICLDDVQWADSGTAAAPRALPSRLKTVPVIWALAFRPNLGSITKSKAPSTTWNAVGPKGSSSAPSTTTP